MALRSEQARVLRRRVLGGLIRNLVLFSAAFALACAAVENFMVPSIANYVADATSTWRTLNSAEQFQQIISDQGMLDDANLFDQWVVEAAEGGYPDGAGTIKKIQGEVDEMEDDLAEYANSMAASPEDAKAAAAKARERAQEAGLPDTALATDSTPGNAAASGEGNLFIDGEAGPSDGFSDSGENSDESISDTAPRAVPLIPYRTILAAENINPDEASGAQAMAALRV